MEKKTPHCKLTVVKELVEAEKVRATMSALKGAADFDGILCVVCALSKTDFYKSMTMHAYHRIWQDVYRKKYWLVRST